jgi:hypothetical protein
MQYEEALRKWGAKKLAQQVRYAIVAHNNTKRYDKRVVIYPEPANPEELIDPESIKIEMNFDEGFACCGGYNPDCYCSFASSPKAEVKIRGIVKSEFKEELPGNIYHWLEYTIDLSDFDFVTVLQEILEVAGDTITK